MRHLLPALLLLAAGPLAAQPLTQLRPAGSLDAVDVLALAALDNAELEREAQAEAALVAGPTAHAYARARTVAIAAGERGTWERLPDGALVWRLVVSSPGARALNLGFSRFDLPAGARLWMYAPGEAPTFRAFSASDRGPDGSLWTPLVEGDRVVLELNLPAGAQPESVNLELGTVSHAFRPVLGYGRRQIEGAKSGSCNVDTTCPEGDAYEDITQSVGQYVFRSGASSFVCTGSAANNTDDDDTPYFLTANHCISTQAEAATIVVYWNYENTTCRTPGSTASGQPGNGRRDQFTSGSTLQATYSPADVTLLELTGPILDDYNVYFAGWNRADTAPSEAVAIHHPQGQEKRISFENDATSITAYLSNSPSASARFVRVGDWDLGTTEGGSSGSPLFDGDDYVVGVLTGGYAACGNNDPDWYGRIASAWVGGGSTGSALRSWLDPTGTGATTHNGRFRGTTVSNETGPEDRAVALSGPFPNPARESATLALTLDRAQAVRVTVYDARGRRVAVLFEGTAPGGTALPLAVDTAEWPAGTYLVRVEGAGVEASRALTVVR